MYKCNNCEAIYSDSEAMQYIFKCRVCRTTLDAGITYTRGMVKDTNPIEPSHYTDLKISPLEYIEANEGEFTWCVANVIKYVSRYKRKNGIEDLLKSHWYLTHQIEVEYNKLSEEEKEKYAENVFKVLNK